MNEPQVWTVIVGFSGLTIAMFGMFQRTMKAEFRALRAEFGGRFDALDAKFDGKTDALDHKIDALSEVMHVRFSSVDHRLDALESDMTTIKRALLGKISA